MAVEYLFPDKSRRKGCEIHNHNNLKYHISLGQHVVLYLIYFKNRDLNTVTSVVM